MAVYVFSLLVGYEKSGVDVAQGKRAKYFKNIGLDSKYVFMNVPSFRDVTMYNELGISVADIILAPCWYAGLTNYFGCIDFDEFVNELKVLFGNVRVETEGNKGQKYASFYRNGELCVQVKCLYDMVSFYEVLYWSKGELVEKEVYSNKLIYTDYYSLTEEDKGKRIVIRRCFKNDDGKDALSIFFDSKNNSTYMLNDGRLVNEEQFAEVFVRSLCLNKEDIILVDRPAFLSYIRPLMQNKGEAYLAVFFHSNHFNELYGPYGWGINKEYLLYFQCSDMVDSFIVSTKGQRRDLIEKLEEFGCSIPEVKVIPACGLERLRESPKSRKRNSIITTCRIDLQKGIEWMIDAVIRAHADKPDITFDIYGTTSDSYYIDALMKRIEESNAQDYIKMMGRQDVSDKYVEYEMFLTASRGESLGLSMMEAVGSGNVMVGLDTKYGSGVFIHTSENGYAIKTELSKMSDASYREGIINNLARAIVEVFADETKVECYRSESYEIAEKYLDENIELQWENFLTKEVKKEM